MNNPFEELNARLSNIEDLLLDIQRQKRDEKPNIITESDEVLTVQETAEFLHLTVPTIYSMIRNRQIPVLKRNRRCYFRKDDILNYLMEGRQKSLQEEASNHFTKKG